LTIPPRSRADCVPSTVHSWLNAVYSWRPAPAGRSGRPPPRTGTGAREGGGRGDGNSAMGGAGQPGARRRTASGAPPMSRHGDQPPPRQPTQAWVLLLGIPGAIVASTIAAHRGTTVKRGTWPAAWGLAVAATPAGTAPSVPTASSSRLPHTAALFSTSFSRTLTPPKPRPAMPAVCPALGLMMDQGLSGYGVACYSQQCAIRLDSGGEAAPSSPSPSALSGSGWKERRFRCRSVRLRNR
jgi:hypothetical protein